jgi:hypothetical protein
MSTAITHRFRLGQLTIDVLSDDDLLYIFSLYRQELTSPDDTWPWQALVHVCQRWRHIIFAWPHHLDVQLDCNATTDVAKLLDVWPTLPISLRSSFYHNPCGDDNDIITKLQHRDRIVRIGFDGLRGTQFKRCVALMQESFPVLRYLRLASTLHRNTNDFPVLTYPFLAGSAPHLRLLSLRNIQFPSLPKFLLTTRNLVSLELNNVTNTEGYISPDTVATCISMLIRLQFLYIRFQSQRSFSNLGNPRHPSLTCAVLPSLSVFMFRGISEYLEALMAQISAPRLKIIYPEVFYQPIFDITQLLQFMHRSEIFRPPIESHADVSFNDGVHISLLPPDDGGCFNLRFHCTGSDRQLSLLKHIFTQCLPLLPRVCHLSLSGNDWHDPELDQQDSSTLLGFLRLFNAVQILYVGGLPPQYYLVIHIARVLGELTRERAVEVLPMLHTLEVDSGHVEHLVTPVLKPFIDTRQLSGHPVAVRVLR